MKKLVHTQIQLNRRGRSLRVGIKNVLVHIVPFFPLIYVIFFGVDSFLVHTYFTIFGHKSRLYTQLNKLLILGMLKKVYVPY